MKPASSLPDQQELTRSIDLLDKELVALRARFDLFFLGQEKRNPAKEMEHLKKRLWSLKGEFVRNTALKFRIQSLVNKFQTYERLWVKTLKEAEEGTEHREILRLRHKNLVKHSPPPMTQPPMARVPSHPITHPVNAESLSQEHDVDLDDLFDQQITSKTPTNSEPTKETPVAPPRLDFLAPKRQEASVKQSPRRAEENLPSTGSSGGAERGQDVRRDGGQAFAREKTGKGESGSSANALVISPAKVRTIYDAYINAKKRCGESIEGVTLEAVSRSLHRQLPQLVQNGAKAVHFKVVVKDGKAVLKAMAK